MTFAKAHEIFMTKYPEGELVQHGKFGGTQKNMKITVIFKRGGRCYEYYGAYEDVLCRIGIKVISKERLAEAEINLQHLKEQHGKVCEFFGTHVIDNSKEIARVEAFLQEVHDSYIIA